MSSTTTLRFDSAAAVAEPEAGARLRRVRHAVLHRLSREEQLLIILRYAEGMSSDEIASTLDMTPARVDQRHDAILAKLRTGETALPGAATAA